MAAAAFDPSVRQDSLNCSICLGLLTDPVSLACGHNYCMKCLNGFWDQEDEWKAFTCPQCRRRFVPRPVLQKNILLAEILGQPESGERQEELQPADKINVPGVAGRRAQGEEVGESGRELQEKESDGHCVFRQGWFSHSDLMEDTPRLKSHILPDPRVEMSGMVLPEPGSRAVHRYSQDTTLYSEESRKVTVMRSNQSPLHQPGQSFHHTEVLSRETLTTASYCEEERTENISMAFTYENVSSSRIDNLFG